MKSENVKFNRSWYIKIQNFRIDSWVHKCKWFCNNSLEECVIKIIHVYVSKTVARAIQRRMFAIWVFVCFKRKNLGITLKKMCYRKQISESVSVGFWVLPHTAVYQRGRRRLFSGGCLRSENLQSGSEMLIWVQLQKLSNTENVFARFLREEGQVEAKNQDIWSFLHFLFVYFCLS